MRFFRRHYSLLINGIKSKIDANFHYNSFELDLCDVSCAFIVFNPDCQQRESYFFEIGFVS